jgi:histidinol dehydrogenase
VQKEIDRQLPKRARRELIERALARNGWLVRVSGLEQGIDWPTSLRPNTLR